MRYNIFNQIHKALRALLYDTALGLQRTTFTNSAETEMILQRLRSVLEMFDKHADHEDNFILPAIAKFEPSLVDAFEQEHDEDHKLAEDLRNLTGSFQQMQTAEEQVKAGEQILHSFIAFMNFNLAHMQKEETVLNERLWKYYSDIEIIEIDNRIVASLPVEEMNFASTWMMQGLNNTEITRWLKEVQTAAPEFVFTSLFSIAEKELPADRFRSILENLTEGAMIA